MDTVSTQQLEKIANTFEQLCHLTGFSVIHNEAEYEQAMTLVRAILDSTRGSDRREDANNPLSKLLRWMTPAIAAYEAQHWPMPAAEPHEVVRFLMEQHHLGQSDVPELGTPEEVSRILSGQRPLDTRQIAALTERFGVSASALMRPVEAVQEIQRHASA